MTTHNTEICQEELERLRQEVAELRDVEARLRREIAERQRVEGTLRRSEARFRTLVEQSPFSIILYDKDGRILMANPASKALWRLSPAEFSYLIANYNILQDEALAQTPIFEGIKRAFAGETAVIPPSIYDFQDLAVPKNAPANMWVSARAYPIKDEADQVHEVVVMHEDVSERIGTETALRQSQAQFKAFFSQSLDGCFFMLLDEPLRWNEATDKEAALTYAFAHQRITEINQAMLDQYGAEEAAFIGLTPTDLMAHDLEHGRKMWRTLFDNGRIHLESDERKLDGRTMWVEGEYVCLYDEDGRIIGHFGIQREITDRKQAEADLRQSEALHRTLVQTIPYGVQEVDVDGRIVYVNPAFCRTTGYAKEELIGRAIWELLPDEAEQRQLRQLLQHLHAFHPQPESYYAVAQTKDGRMIQTQTDWDYRRAADGTITGTIAVVTDITARKQAEERLEHYAQRLEIVHEVAQAILTAQSPEAIAYATLTHIREALPFSRSSVVLFDFATNQGVVLASFDRQETGIRAGMSRPLNEFDIDERLYAGEHVVRDRLNDVMPALVKRLQAEGVHSYLSFPLYVRSQLIGALYLASGELDLRSDYYIETLREIAEFLSIAIQQARLHEGVQQRSDELERRVAIRTRDLTEANEKLKEMDRLKSKFISDVSHELRTPVTNLSLYLDLIENGRPERAEHYRTVLREQTERLKLLVEGTLDLSRLDVRRDELSLTPQSVNLIVERTAAACWDLAQAKGVAFDVILATDLPDILADPEQIGRAIDSLLQNAIQYTSSGRALVRTFYDETAVSVAIQVEDTGMGLDEEDLAHCFEPFYRGVRVGQLNIPGSGLGLALAQEIVAQHNGRITVESVVDEGSVFTIWLPLAVGDEQ